MKTITTWKGDLVFESMQEEGGSLLMDGNLKKGLSPKALLLAGLSGCSAVDVVEILHKMRINFTSLQVVSEADQTDQHPRVFKDITLTFILKAEQADLEKIQKAVDLSMEKYCGVAAMLRKNSLIHAKLQLT
ncbi:MAG: OsmC family protein [Bacteroidetes bacterium]|nr:OsmC family protein [Bacteroidota bacterium]